MTIRMQQRRGTAQQWTNANPVLAAGEIGFETDTGKFKMGNGSSSWSTLSYFTDSQDFDTASLESTMDSKVSAAQTTLTNAITNHTIATTNVHGIADVAALATKSYSDTAVSDAVTGHNNQTINVHGIANTADLATESYVDTSLNGAINTHNSDTTNVHGIANTADLATKSYADTAVSDAVNGHSSDTTNVHGITDTAELETKTGAQTKATTAEDNAKAYTDTHSSDTTNVHGIANTANLVLTNDARLSDERTPLDYSVNDNKISTNGLSQSSISNLTTDLAAKANLESPSLTGTPTAPTAAAGTNTTQIATTAFVKAEVDAVIAAAPGALNTLDELAAALGDDANFATTVTNALATKASTTDLNNALLYSFNNRTSSYTVALSDATNMVEMDSSSATTVTIPTNASVAFPIGTTIDVFQKGTGQVTMVAASGVTVQATPGLKLRAQFSGATLIKRDTNTWILTGDIVA